jgi:hypothetical protein
MDCHVEIGTFDTRTNSMRQGEVLNQEEAASLGKIPIAMCPNPARWINRQGFAVCDHHKEIEEQRGMTFTPIESQPSPEDSQ